MPRTFHIPRTERPAARSAVAAAVGAIWLIAGLLAPVRAWSEDARRPLPAARITIKEARRIALKAHPGRIVAEELEREAGGSGLRYSFDIRVGEVTQEVGVDAVTGRVLENVPEGAHPD